MPTVFIVARDWTLRTALRAELREQGIDAVGLDSADDLGRAIASGRLPAVAVIEAIPEIAANSAVQTLVGRVPTILIASRTETIPLPEVDTVLYRPVRIGEITARVNELLLRGCAG